jgi:hypothetical protein
MAGKRAELLHRLFGSLIHSISDSRNAGSCGIEASYALTSSCTQGYKL